MLPLNLQRDAYAGRRPEVVFFYDNQHMTVGGILARGATDAVGEAGAGVQVALRNSQGEPVELAQAAITPIPIHQNTLFNPALNYAHFLLAALLPAVLQIIIVTTSAYSVGLDIEGRYRLATLRRLGGDCGRRFRQAPAAHPRLPGDLRARRQHPLRLSGDAAPRHRGSWCWQARFSSSLANCSARYWSSSRCVWAPR